MSEGTKVKKASAVMSHPKYIDMVTEAIKALKERNGSSRQAICKNILAAHPELSSEKANNYVRSALKKGLEKGVLKRPKGSAATGATGRFKLGDVPPEKKSKPKKSATTKKPAKPKKSGKKKTSTTKAGKKPSSKKSAAKTSAKSPGKKTTKAKKTTGKTKAKSATKAKPKNKKVAKKPAAKKSTPKKTLKSAKK